MRPDVGEVELSREPDALPEKERMLAGGVGRRDGPKHSALRERAGGLCSILGVSSALTSDASDFSESARLGGFGGGWGIEMSSPKGEAKKALVLLPVGDGNGDGADDSEVRTLRWDERVEELAVEDEGLRWKLQLSSISTRGLQG